MEIRDTLIEIKGWLKGVRENRGVGYYNYITALDRRANNTHSDQDVKALQLLRKELMKNYMTPRSQQESLALEQYVDTLTEALRTTQLQLQTTS